MKNLFRKIAAEFMVLLLVAVTPMVAFADLEALEAEETGTVSMVISGVAKEAVMVEEVKEINTDESDHAASEKAVSENVGLPGASAADDPLCFTATKDNSSVTLCSIGGAGWINGKIKRDSGDWEPYTVGTEIELCKGQSVYFLGESINMNKDSRKHLQFCMSGRIEASGNIMSLCAGLPFERQLSEYMAHLFEDCKSLTKAPDIIADAFSESCFLFTFKNCTSLTAPPRLEVATLSAYCYGATFSGCTGIRLSETKTDEYTIEWKLPDYKPYPEGAFDSMFVGTGGTFTGTPVVGRTYYLAPPRPFLDDAEVSAVADQEYTGGPVTPEPTVKYGDKTLISGTDFTCSYEDNVEIGTAKITITGTAGGDYDGSQTVTFKITEPAVHVTGVSVSPEDIDLKVNQSAGLTATVLPDNAADTTVSWESDDETVATVSADGKVTGIAAGTATITVTTKDGDHKATCRVTVTGDTPQPDPDPEPEPKPDPEPEPKPDPKPEPVPSDDSSDDHDEVPYTGSYNANLYGGSEPEVTGEWFMDPSGQGWSLLVGGEKIVSSWKKATNPYAPASMAKVSWFYFDENGRMLTGWQWIKGSDGLLRCYYLNPTSNGLLGACFLGGKTPDGYTVDSTGAWTVNGVVQTR